MQVRRPLRADPKLPLHTLPGGFSPTPGEETPKEKLEGSDDNIDKINHQSYNKKKNINSQKKHVKLVRRGGDSRRKHMKSKCASSVKLFSANCAGLKNGKLRSLNAEVYNSNSNIVTLQETHFKQKGKIHMDKCFVIFEAIRAKKGGGTAVAIHENLKPKLIKEYSDQFELLVVEIKTENTAVRIISGYGPQENLEEEKRREFFVALETEVEKAELAGKSVIIELDANSKLGKKYIINDPHDMSPNGALLSDIIERHSLIVGNGSDKCTGTITRKRTTRNKCEQSVIDIVLFSSDLSKHLVSVHIDEERKHVLRRIYKTKKGTKIKESNHNTITTEFNNKVTSDVKGEKTEFYNLKNKDCLAKFKAYTSKSNMLSSVFDSNDDIDVLTKRLVKKINGCIAMNFTKRRIGTQENTNSDNDLYARMSNLKGKNDIESKADLKEATDTIAERTEQNYIKLKEELSKLKSKGGLDAKQLWRLKKRLCPKSRDPPTAMLDKHNNLLTSDPAIQERALEVFTDRLDNNDINPNLRDLENDTNELCRMRLKASKLNESDPWTMSDLQEALKQLENNKSRDAEGFANELFKNGGSDLLEAVLRLMNLIKDTQTYPKIMEKCNITSIHKKKSKKDFKNYRGVFRVQILRSILDRLTYNDCYYTIDKYLTDGNVGARKHRSVRDNIFVLFAITNSVINGNSPPIQVQVMDQKTCFDKL